MLFVVCYCLVFVIYLCVVLLLLFRWPSSVARYSLLVVCCVLCVVRHWFFVGGLCLLFLAYCLLFIVV